VRASAREGADATSRGHISPDLQLLVRRYAEPIPPVAIMFHNAEYVFKHFYHALCYDRRNGFEDIS
jgi:hypothetical protein